MDNAKMNLLKKHKSFDGSVFYYEHFSTSTQTPMKFSLYLPKSYNKNSPVLFFLSGLTCTEENFMTKSGVQKWASQKNMIVVAPDTSPRGTNLPKEHESYDFGSGASFYLNAQTDGYKDHYNMEDYLVHELPELLKNHLNAGIMKMGISGHSMGGHGALTLGIKHPHVFQSVSAFSPICSPINCPWGVKALEGYLGPATNQAMKDLWRSYDACELMKDRKYTGTILVDQGLDDEFLKEQLKPELFKKACEETKASLELRMHDGYDHSYYFVSTFMEDHMNFHAARLS